MMSPFKNEPFTDFSTAENAGAMREALADVTSQLGREYPLVINGEHITTGSLLVSTNPSNPEQVVGSVNLADQEIASRALEVCTEAERMLT